MADGLARQGHTVTILAGHWHGQPEGTVRPASDNIGIVWFKMCRIPGLNGAFSPDVTEKLLGLAPDRHTIVHDNGPWFLYAHSIARAARRRGFPLVFCPRGNLTDWAFRYRGWKKRLCWSLYVRRDVNSAAVVHATSEQEMKDLWKLGVSRPVAIVPNAVTLPTENACAVHDAGLSCRRALFLSRISVKKGLPMLVDAWNRVRPANWKLVIAGTDEEGHWSVVKRRIDDLGLTQHIEYIGGVSGPAREDAYKSADLFILPSFTENYGLVIAEALASCVPVITTTGTPWQSIEEHNCGFWIEPEVGALEVALRTAVALSPQERLAMGRRGRELIAKEHSWDRIAQRMERVYEWAIDRGPKPDWLFDSSSRVP